MPKQKKQKISADPEASAKDLREHLFLPDFWFSTWQQWSITKYDTLAVQQNPGASKNFIHGSLAEDLKIMAKRFKEREASPRKCNQVNWLKKCLKGIQMFAFRLVLFLKLFSKAIHKDRANIDFWTTHALENAKLSSKRALVEERLVVETLEKQADKLEENNKKKRSLDNTQDDAETGVNQLQGLEDTDVVAEVADDGESDGEGEGDSDVDEYQDIFRSHIHGKNPARAELFQWAFKLDFSLPTETVAVERCGFRSSSSCVIVRNN
ncbi:hypothetical protein BCR43DRAFT_514516 [Syncephalastrum racemosum]|uniref:Uncharacterized protein n=1 Tax=Syncephalastrum racemosum TaxID=13706 RepID=A0A1X2HGU6_SYNRA|nr:hypothetical protein BCR43DRAFT_514516 [Syncephalastrum racemosum]